MDYKDFNDYELLNYIAEGNEDANNIIIKKYEPLINKIALKMLPYCKNNGLDLSDLVQEGMIGLNHAIEKYQEMGNTLFYTYAGKCIERKIISVVISSNRNKNKILNESISYDDDENLIIKFIKDSNDCFDKEIKIPVDQETRSLFCVANASKNPLKVQFSMREASYKYEIRTEPQIILLQSGEACEFEIFLKPLCTTSIDDSIKLISKNLKKSMES